MRKETVKTLKVENDKLKEKLEEISNELKKVQEAWRNNKMAAMLKLHKIQICQPPMYEVESTAS